MKTLMTGGGTGGHLYPALAVADALRQISKEAEILFVGSNRGLESREVPEAGYAFKGLDSIGFPRRLGPRTVAALWSFARAVLAARGLLRGFGPQVVFSTGGYVSAPVVLAARLERVPVVLHEQNSIPGVTNRIASRLATEVHLAFASARRFFPRRRHLRLSGNPLRETVTSGSRARALRLFRLDEERQTILVFGGSQGAHSINEAVLAALPFFEGREDVQFLLQSGDADYERVLEKCRVLKVKTWVRRFIANMGDAYALADLVVCRAGAMTLSELAACGLPSILIPYPHATANHQWVNAEQMVEAGAAMVVADGELNGPLLARQIEELLSSRRRLREMRINALRMARPGASEKIARALLKFRPPSEVPLDLEPARPRYDRRSRGQAPRKVGPSRILGRNLPGQTPEGPTPSPGRTPAQPSASRSGGSSRGGGRSGSRGGRGRGGAETSQRGPSGRSGRPREGGGVPESGGGPGGAP